MKHQTPDIVIPLGSGSKHNNFELRMALRGIARFVRDPGQVYIVSDQLPEWVQNVMQVAPTTHFVEFCQAILFRGAGFSVVWKPFAMLLVIGLVLFAFSLNRFRRSVAQ